MTVGKLPPSRLEKVLAGSVGARSTHVLVGPGAGLDAAVLDLGDGRVMAVAEDPIFPAPGLPLDVFGWFTVHIGASDVAVTGVKPSFMTYTLLLPPDLPTADAEVIIDSISREAERLDIAIVGGHTGWYPAVTLPTVGGVTVWGFAPCPDWVSPAGAKPGDVILLTKGPAIEASALLAVLYRDRIAGSLTAGVLDSLLSRVRQITVVYDALLAFRAGGVHSMHDATEGGVLGGLWEMCAASGLSAEIDLDGVSVPHDIAQLAALLSFDPWAVISEGSLLASVGPEAVEAVSATLVEAGIEVFELGRFTTGSPSTVRRDGQNIPLKEPGEDPFWSLFFAGLP